MTTASTLTAFPSRAEAWLDERGKPAWIAEVVLGFILFWPVGLALLAYMIWSRRMFSRKSSCARGRHGSWGRHHTTMSGSGNTAFDAYKADMLRRLEDEQQAFEAFLQRLRDSKDKSEFDQFMDDRARNAQTPAQSPAHSPAHSPAGETSQAT